YIMSPVAISLFTFALYVEIMGILLAIIPNKILPLFKEPKTDEPWVRILGIILMALGFYYIVAAQNEITVIFWASVVARYGAFVGFSLLVITKKARPTLIGFAIIDALGATWTLLVM
ncbi:MAG: hypothetical protein ABFS32_18045, partial [Bacteroidota bacterium]